MKSKLKYMLCPIIVAIITVIFLNVFLDKKVNSLLESKDLTTINSEYGSIYKDKGVTYNEYITRQNELVLQGSSELASPVSQLPTTFFPVEGLDTVVTNGRAHSQNLHQISMLGSQNENVEGKKVAIIISLQWFLENEGIATEGFQANFSPIQFYNFLNNEKISLENKKEYASRINNLLSGSTQFLPECLYAKLYVNDSILHKTTKIICTPYFYCRKKMVALKDKGLLYKKLITLQDKKEINSQEVNWNKEREKAENDGKSKVTNNDFMVYDSYYDNNLKANLKSQKDVNKNIDLMKSKEFKDYELYLDTCVELGIKPYIILMPTNGLWYDYTGMKKETRDEFYDEIQKMAEYRGFDVLNLKDEEYTPYFMCDVMHLGWKGWLRVDEELYKYFKK